MSRKAFTFNSLGVALILLLTGVGELYRFQGYLLLDLVAPLFVFAWFAHTLVRKRTVLLPDTFYPALLFLALGLGSLLLNSANMDTSSVLESAFYGVRFANLYGLSILVLNQSSEEKQVTWASLCLLTLLLCIAGFIQLKIAPDFTQYEALGWDPHQNRLLSTWFDPNFVGGFLAFMIPIFLARTWEDKKSRKFLIPLLGLALIALALTLSRSSYLALLTGLLVFGLLRSYKVLLAGTLILATLLFLVPSVQTRVVSLVESASSMFSETYTLPDASSRLRFASWEEAWQLFLEKPLLGHGYNRYKYAALELGTLDDLEIHSASGSDSSLLNVLATTGILGFIPFLSIYLLLAIHAWKNRSSFGGGFFASLCGLFIHSIFVNSLLFPLFMDPFWVSAGLLQSKVK